MTGVALRMFDQPRSATPPREIALRGEFANLVSDQMDWPADPTKRLLDGDAQSHNDALLAVLTIPQAELPSGAITEAIATEVSMVIDVPVEMSVQTVPASTIATTASIAAAIAGLVQAAIPVETKLCGLGGNLIPITIDAKSNDGVPTPMEAGPRPRARRGTDDDAKSLALPIPEAVRELMHARTMLMSIVDEDTIQTTTIQTTTIQTDPIQANPTHANPIQANPIQVKPGVTAIPDVVPVIEALTAKRTPVASTIAQAPLTPLEQAVQDLIAELADRDAPSTTIDASPMSIVIPEVKLLSIKHADTPTPVVTVRDAQLPEPQANPSHVHLVIDDGVERVVITVAVRGSEVSVALRGQDDATSAALARNAGSLDHSMRARGLDLASLMTYRDPDARQHRPSRDARDRGIEPKELFSIEELA